MVPELLLVGAGDVGDNELHILLNQLALLPGHGLALVSPSPDLRIHSVFNKPYDEVLGAAQLIKRVKAC